MLKATSSNVNVSQITGVLPVVNGGTGVTTSTGTGNTVLSAAPTLSGNVTLSTGNLIVASGQGIDFSADPSAPGMTSELLDDYEEGTWTPVDASGAGLVFTDNVGKYTKTGRCVVCTFAIRFPITLNGSANTITGLPFVVAAGLGTVSLGYTTYSVTDPIYSLPGPTGNPLFAFYSGAGAPLANSALSTAYFNGTIVYFV